MKIDQVRLSITRSDIKNLKQPTIDDIHILTTEDTNSENYYKPFIAIIEQLFCS